MNQSFWQARWSQGRIGFHQSTVNDALLRFGDTLVPKGCGSVLVPLSGKSLDIAWLAGRFGRVVAVEFVAQALDEFFTQWAGEGAYEVKNSPFGKVFSAKRGDAAIVGHAWDFFDLSPESAGCIDAVYDRAALIALPKAQRALYARHLLQFLPSDGRLLLVSIDHPGPKEAGPPFSVPPAEVKHLFGAAGCLQQLEERLNLPAPAGLLAVGVETIAERVWLLERSHKRPTTRLGAAGKRLSGDET